MTALTSFLLLGVVASACSSAPRQFSAPPDASAPSIERPADEPASYDADDFWEDDPPPEWCGPGKAPADAIPGGTPECPSDKNKAGCPCDELGKEAACWPGLRKHRKLGICKDGVARCVAQGELGKVWGPCEGAVKPRAGATKGKDACACFSAGKWDIENVVPCFVEVDVGKYAAVSTEAGGECPASLANLTRGEMPDKPAGTWSANRLTADCAGAFELCYTIKAGDPKSPSAGDCVVARACTKGDYKTPNKAQAFPDLPHWVTPDTTCATRFQTEGGYAEMTVKGESVRCDEVSDDGKPLVFRRNGFCPVICSEQPSRPECQECAKDATGEF